jgi:DNA-directed RNA polymerase specialized sigma24 family protein
LKSHSHWQQEEGLVGAGLTQADRAVWSEGEVQLAIRELSDADVLGLKQTARALAHGCHLAPEELLSEAIGLLLEGIRTVPRSAKFLVVLRGAMRSLAFNDRKRHDNSRVDAGDDEKLIGVKDASLSPENELASKKLREAVLALFAGDDLLQTICEGWFFEQMTEKEICDLTELDMTTLGSRKRAITRKLARSSVGAHLK